MKRYVITFKSRETLPDRLEAIAADLGITPEQLIKRFIGAGMTELEGDSGPCTLGDSLEDFLIKNKVWRPNE